MIRIDETRCDGCGLCVEACPTGAIRLVEGVARVDPNRCRGCEVCLEACPRGAITSVQEPAEVLKPVPVRTPSPVPARSAPLTTRSTGRLLPWLGAALAFVGREVIPRVAVALLDAWDRRQARPVQVVSSPASGVRTTASRRPAVTDAGMGRRRWRHRRRGRWRVG